MHTHPLETTGQVGPSAGSAAPGRTPLTATGMSAATAQELERRLEIVAAEEAAGDPTRQPLSTAELLTYVAVTVVLCLAGLLLVIL